MLDSSSEDVYLTGSLSGLFDKQIKNKVKTQNIYFYLRHQSGQVMLEYMGCSFIIHMSNYAIYLMREYAFTFKGLKHSILYKCMPKLFLHLPKSVNSHL